ncbi:glycosyltransferase family 4 protein [Candidatus Roizmanbacteria bacterium]|nr:glycosyltransferase family 4 protein [Candidatus Roizmanbacteria bacterium]
MKILILFNRYAYRGGEDTYVDNLVELLKKNGHRARLYIKDSRSIKMLSDKIKAGIGLFWNFQTARELDKIIVEFKPDIAHFHNIYPLISPTAYYICKKNGVKIIQTIHNYKFVCPKNSLFREGKICELCVTKSFAYPSIIYGCYHNSKLASLIYSLAFFIHKKIGSFNLIDTYIFPSPFTQEYYLKYVGIPKKKTIVLPYFVSPSQKTPQIVPRQDFFLYVGRLSEEKGISRLLKAFKSLPKHKLRVVGDGPLKDGLVKKYAKFKNIIFIPLIKQSEVFIQMRQARAVIVPSLWYEVQPNVILEAIATHCPIIIPKTKNYSSWVPKKTQVFTYQMNDLNSLKRAILASNSKKIPQLQKSSLSKTMAQFSPLFHYKNLMKIYEN